MAARPLIRLLPALSLGLALLAAGAGCSGYSTSRLTDFPRARTIAVLPIENLGYRRDLALRLTQAIANEIRARSSLGFATAETADLILSGKVTASEVPIVLDETGDVIQKRLEGSLQIEVRDRVSGRIVRRGSVYATEEFRPGVQGESLGGSATHEWTRRIAELVAQQLERGF